MGNAHGAPAHCFISSSGGKRWPRRRRFFSSSAVTSETIADEGLGHSFRYVPPPPPPHAFSAKLTKVCHSDQETSTSLPSITGAAISANPAAPPSTALLAAELLPSPPAASFESSPSFASVRLQRLPRFSASMPSSSSGGGPSSDPLSIAGFQKFMSAPLDKSEASVLFSGPFEKPAPSAFSAHLNRSSSLSLPQSLRTSTAAAAFRGLAKAVVRIISRGSGSVEGLKNFKSTNADDGLQRPSSSSSNLCGSSSCGNSNISYVEDAWWSDETESQVDVAHQWAQGKAGEDRVHVVVSKEHGYVFVGIYDGFNGPDAADFLLSNLYPAVDQELKGLLWEDKEGSNPATLRTSCIDSDDPSISTNPDALKNSGRKTTVTKAAEENRRQRDSHWGMERLELKRRPRDKLRKSNVGGAASHLQVLKALSRALKKTEETFFDIADKMASENPELALMGSCVLVMLMKGADVYLMNVGDSRAVMAQQDTGSSRGKTRKDLGSIKEDCTADVAIVHDGGDMEGLKNLKAMQLTLDHNTSAEQEVRRIRHEHPCDSSVIANGRVKGSLKVTRAFGAGFLKQPKWNDALLEMFRIDYVGASPYITCNPFLYHHKLRPTDKFLILSSDGLYQYFSNEEVVAQVEKYVAGTPDGDPAQHLAEELLVRAAKRAGMDLQELLDVPHGERRRYHDDISIVIIPLEGQIWRSCV